jgi:hypothetical protein
MAPPDRRPGVLQEVAFAVGELLDNGVLPNPTAAAHTLTDVALELGMSPVDAALAIRTGFTEAGVAAW